MNIVIGASGQVGSAIVENLVSRNEPVKAIIRNPDKRKELQKLQNIVIETADAFDLPALTKAFKNGSSVLLLTPDNPESNDVMGETKTMLDNYKKAIEGSQIKKIVGLSSMGAQIETSSGSLKMSYLLEHNFAELKVQKIFVRPAYYYSNWMESLSAIQEEGVLPTFFPVDLKIPMVSPLDVAKFLASLMSDPVESEPIFEVEGPAWYSSNDIANAFGKVLNRSVVPQQIPREDWWKTIKEFGFTDDVTKNFIEMTQTVVDGKAKPHDIGTILKKVDTPFKTYLKEQLEKHYQNSDSA
ncbi:MAG TPA: NmrA family NAD(P)-binding protein [Chryseolinea sp.]|nr:NmrA family NAD(P)-binding protein [Chryseolinea sp.]